MILVLSPSKTLHLDNTPENIDLSTPKFNKKAIDLMKILKKLTKEDLRELMNLSDNLASINYDRIQNFSSRHTMHNSYAALFAFKGDVYVGLDVEKFSDHDIAYANDHLFILSGLYGILRPLDKMQPYRLEMGTPLKNKMGSNLYSFWGDHITSEINRLAKKVDTQYLVNLASNEYFDVLHSQKLKPQVIDIDFREKRNGQLRFISYNAKMARGTMARFIIQNKLTTKEDLFAFNLDGYQLDSTTKNSNKLLFIK